MRLRVHARGPAAPSCLIRCRAPGAARLHSPAARNLRQHVTKTYRLDGWGSSAQTRAAPRRAAAPPERAKTVALHGAELAPPRRSVSAAAGEPGSAH